MGRVETVDLFGPPRGLCSVSSGTCVPSDDAIDQCSRVRRESRARKESMEEVENPHRSCDTEKGELSQVAGLKEPS